MDIIILTIIRQQNVIMFFFNMEVTSAQYEALVFVPHVQGMTYHF